MSDEQSERAQVRSAKRTAQIKRRDQLALLSGLMAEPAGREFIYDSLSACHIFSTTFATNALAMSFREGERNVGLRLLTDITEASPDMYLQMLKEAANVRSSQSEPDADADASE